MPTNLSSWIEALGMLALAITAVWQIVESRRILTRQIEESREAERKRLGFETWMAFDPRLDSPEMKQARRLLAEQAQPTGKPGTPGEVNETVLDFFESVGIAYNRGLLDKDLAASTFSYYVNHWWQATNAYIAQERKRHNDATLFEEFEKMAAVMKSYDPHIDDAALNKFLDDEKRLR